MTRVRANSSAGVGLGATVAAGDAAPVRGAVLAFDTWLLFVVLLVQASAKIAVAAVAASASLMDFIRIFLRKTWERLRACKGMAQSGSEYRSCSRRFSKDESQRISLELRG